MSDQLHRVAEEKCLFKFNRELERFRKMAAERNIACNDWVEQNQIFWSLACDNAEGGRLWSIMTSNMAESINGVFKGIRAFLIASLVQHTFWRVLRNFDKRRLEIEAQIEGGRIYKKCEELMKKNSQKAIGHTVTGIDRRNGVYVVETPPNNISMTGQNTLTVNFDYANRVGFCSCGKFQGHKIPCSHAIAACNVMGANSYRFVNDFYKLETMMQCYGTSFTPLGEPKGWRKHNGPTLHPSVNMTRQPGRPRTTRIHNEMDMPREGITRQVCGSCKQSGHNAATCRGDGQGRGRGGRTSGGQRRESGGQRRRRGGQGHGQ